RRTKPQPPENKTSKGHKQESLRPFCFTQALLSGGAGKLSNDCPHSLKRFISPGRFRPARLRHVRAATATLAAHGSSTRLHKFNRVEALGQISGDTDSNRALAVFGNGNKGHHAGADLLLAVIDKTAQILRIYAFKL